MNAEEEERVETMQDAINRLTTVIRTLIRLHHDDRIEIGCDELDATTGRTIILKGNADTNTVLIYIDDSEGGRSTVFKGKKIAL